MESGDAQVRSLQERLDALERERALEIARANDALAAAQDRSYWLDRWGLDLNALMRRRGASELVTTMRALRLIARHAWDAAGKLAALPHRVAKARQKAARDIGRS
jgi:hypothetical protein